MQFSRQRILPAELRLRVWGRVAGVGRRGSERGNAPLRGAFFVFWGRSWDVEWGLSGAGGILLFAQFLAIEGRLFAFADALALQDVEGEGEPDVKPLPAGLAS